MRFLIFICLLAVVNLVRAQEGASDPAAVLILDKMSSVIGSLQSCSFTLHTSNDEEVYPIGLVKTYGTSKVYMVGPDKMLVHTYQNDHHKGYWYNGDSLTYYSFDENNYVTISAPPTIMATIDSLSVTYEIDFPAADLFYPTLTDDILEYFTRLDYLGNNEVAGQECFHLRAENEEMLMQIWVSNDALNLPVQFVIQDKTKKGQPQYHVEFENWNINPVLPETLFEFIPPPGARLIAIMANSRN